jgi:hypothetical protein
VMTPTMMPTMATESATLTRLANEKNVESTSYGVVESTTVIGTAMTES